MLRSDAGCGAIFGRSPTTSNTESKHKHKVARFDSGKPFMKKYGSFGELIWNGLHSTVNSVRYNADLWKFKLFEMPA